MVAHFTRDELRVLERRLATGEAVCPRCGGPLEWRDVPPRPEVAYVRTRLWVLCPICDAGAVIDRRRIERAGRALD